MHQSQECWDTHEIQNHNYDRTWGWLGAVILWWIIFTVLFWLIYFSLKPNIVLDANNQVDTSKVLLAAVVTSIVLVIIIWIIKVVAFQ